MQREDAIRKGGEAIAAHGLSYAEHLAGAVSQIAEALDEGDLEAVARDVQNIKGEAPLFGWMLAGEIAAILRDIAEAHAFEKREEAAQHCLNALRLVVAHRMRDKGPAGQALLTNLHVMMERLRGPGGLR